MSVCAHCSRNVEQFRCAITIIIIINIQIKFNCVRCSCRRLLTRRDVPMRRYALCTVISDRPPPYRFRADLVGKSSIEITISAAVKFPKKKTCDAVEKPRKMINVAISNVSFQGVLTLEWRERKCFFRAQKSNSNYVPIIL